MNNIKKAIYKQQNCQKDFYVEKNNIRFTKTWKFIVSKFVGNERILDIGCSNGVFSAYLVKKGFKCYGLELDDRAIDKSKKLGILIKKGDFLEKLPFISEMFDMIFAGEVIEHTIDDDGFLKEVCRVLKPGGLLVLTTPNLLSLGNRILMLLGKMPRFAYAQYHYRIYNLQTIKDKIKQSGFQILKTDSSYIIISSAYNRFIGFLSERLASILPSFGEGFIVYAIKLPDESFLES